MAISSGFAKTGTTAKSGESKHLNSCPLPRRAPWPDRSLTATAPPQSLRPASRVRTRRRRLRIRGTHMNEQSPAASTGQLASNRTVCHGTLYNAQLIDRFIRHADRALSLILPNARVSIDQNWSDHPTPRPLCCAARYPSHNACYRSSRCRCSSCAYLDRVEYLMQSGKIH